MLYSGEGDRLRVSTSTGGGGSRRDFEESGKIEEADLNPNLLPVFGGSGGGWSSELELLPVSFREAARSEYFPRINLSIAESASSASKGIGGFALLGL